MIAGAADVGLTKDRDLRALFLASEEVHRGHLVRAERNVELLGKIPVESVAVVYSRADLLMLPSIAEPFGIVAIENSLVGSILSNYTLIRNSNNYK